MSRRPVIVEVVHNDDLENNAVAAMFGEVDSLDRAAVPTLTGLDYDEAYPPVVLPRLVRREHPEGELHDTAASLTFDLSPRASTYLVRGTVDDEDVAALKAEADATGTVMNVYSDVLIAPMQVCPGSPPVGTDADVGRLLDTAKLHAHGMDGSGVLVAIVDSGVNMAYLNSRGKTPAFDPARSWAWDPAQVTPGAAPVGHGTMVAYDVCIAAPRCTILDIALLRPLPPPAPGESSMGALLSDAVRAYSHLLSITSGGRRPGQNSSLVVNNSWGMFDPAWDFPVGDPGNYSDNPNHPFNRIVVTLERAGADILFAAGNCGRDCPDGRCAGHTTRPIYGANSSPAVTSVAGVDVTQVRAGYSAIGPGRLANRKPDISGYTHFRGSGVFSADGGTSAACPVVAGVVAALRSLRPFDSADSTTSPAAIRNLVTSTALDLAPSGYDFEHGHGVVNGSALVDKIVTRPPIIDLCQRFPWICRGLPRDICVVFPGLCREIPIPIPPVPPVPPEPGPFAPSRRAAAGVDKFQGTTITEGDLAGLAPEEVAFILGYMRGQIVTAEREQVAQANSGGNGAR